MWRLMHLLCFKNAGMTKVGVSWQANSKAWMTGRIFKEWLVAWKKKMEVQNRHISLFLDNASCHTHTTLSNFTLKFFLKNETSCLHPLDQKVFHKLKIHYRKNLLKPLIARMNETARESELAKKITVKDAVS